MCGPWALPLALVVGGTAANYFGQQKAAHAQERAYSAEAARQKDLTDQQQAVFDNSLKATTALTDPNAQNKAIADRQSTLAAAITPPSQSAYLPGSSSAPDVVHAAADKANAASKASSSHLAQALAQLGGNSDLLLNTNIAMGRDASQIGQLGSFKRGSAGVLDAEMRAAANKGAFLRGIGSLAQQIGAAWLGSNLAGGIGASAKPTLQISEMQPFNLGAIKMDPIALPAI